MIREQKKAGIEVYSVIEGDIAKRISRDIIIVDDILAGELDVKLDTRDFEGVAVTSGSSDIKRIRKDWNTIYQSSKRE